MMYFLSNMNLLEQIRYIRKNSILRKELKKSIIHAKYETAEFVIGDMLLVSGGFLIGTNYLDFISTSIGSILVAVGLFLGLRVLLKFSSDLRVTKKQVESAIKNLLVINKDVKNNQESLSNASKELQRTKHDLVITKAELQVTKRELAQSLSKFKEVEQKVFGFGGGVFSRSSGFHPLDSEVEKLKKDVDELKRERDRARRGF